MEIKRKKITNEQIYATEQELIQKLNELLAEKKSNFEALGYELEIVIGQKENEAQHSYAPYLAEADKSFEPGYISHAVINVKRAKTAEELEAEARAEQNNREMLDAAENEEEMQAIRDEETLRQADDANRRLVAFTELMLARTYKSFWMEWVSLSEGIGETEADLDEFYGKLQEKLSQN